MRQSARRLIAWALFAVAVPLVAEGLHWAADNLEARRGSRRRRGGLRFAGHVADGMRRSPRR